MAGNAPESQLDKFNQAARELEIYDDPKRFKDSLGKLLKHRPVPVKPDEK